MKTLNISGKIRNDVLTDNELSVCTNNNVPNNTGHVLWISEDVVPYYQKLYDENPDWFIDNNISIVRILKPRVYADMVRLSYEKYGGEYNAIPLSERIEMDAILQKKREIDNAMKVYEEKERRAKKKRGREK